MPARPQPVKSADWWWERSPNSGNSNNFCAVNSDGSANANNASNSNGLAPFGSVPTAECGSESEATGGIRDIEMQEAATAAPRGRNQSRHAGEAGTHRLSQDGLVRFGEVFTFEHLYEAGIACCTGVRWKASTQVFETRLPSWASYTLDRLHDGTWKSSGFNRFTICERGKMRNIQSVHISERMVQKCLVRYCLRPLIIPRIIYDSHATLPGHGTELALSRLKEHLQWHHRRYGMAGYTVTMDYHDYFASIDHKKLIEMYSRLPMDDRLLQLTAYLINCFDGDHGLGLGSEVSQISAVYYVSPVDHMVKDRLGVHCYGRYMDDSYAIVPLDYSAAEVLDSVRDVSSGLGLTFNDKATAIRTLRHGFRYLKKKILLTDTGKVVMRPQRDNIARERRRIRRNLDLVREGRMTLESEQQSFDSWKSHCLRLNARRTVESMTRYRDGLLLKCETEGKPNRYEGVGKNR